MTNSQQDALSLVNTDRLVLSLSTMTTSTQPRRKEGRKERKEGKKEAMKRPGLRGCQLSLHHSPKRRHHVCRGE